MNIWQVTKRLFPFVIPYKYLIAALLFLTLVGAIVAQINPIVLRYTIDTVSRLLKEGSPVGESTSFLLLIVVILSLKGVLNAAVAFFQDMFGDKLRIKLSTNLFHHAIKKILSYNYAYFTDEHNSTGKLQTRIDQGAENLTSFVQNIFIDLLPLFANSILALVLIFYANLYIGLIAAAILPIYFWLSWRQATRLRGLRRELRSLKEEKTTGLFTIIESIIVIKAFVCELYEERKQLILKHNLVKTQMQKRTTNHLFDMLKTLVGQSGAVLIIGFTAYFVLWQNMSVGMIMYHLLLFNNVSAPIRQLHKIYDQVNETMAYAEGYFEVLDAADALEDSGDIKPKDLKGTFELKNVNFIYPNGKHALFDLNIRIPAGKTVAVVGLSGAGKTTLINLLCKFYLPSSGEIFLDGINLRDYDTKLLRDEIGLVLQKNHIFDGTVEENIRYGRTHSSFEEVVEAARRSSLHSQILELPDQYQTNAQSLSGGQQQRIALPRIFLKDPTIIFLDEPTSSLDAVVTEQIKESLDSIKVNRTTIIISHSISQIIDADLIYVIKEGRVVEFGTHIDLYEKAGTYHEIFDSSVRTLNIEKISQTLEFG